MSTSLLTVSTSPHLLGRTTMRSMHVEWLVALAPALLTGFYYFGAPGLITVLLSAASAVVCEAVGLKVTGRDPAGVKDLHALLLGVLLGMVLPAGAPWWLPVAGGFLTVIMGKMIFGGLGAYPMNPVLVAWAALALSWPEQMNSFLSPLALGGAGERLLTETPLMQLKYDPSTLEVVTRIDMWLGASPGAIGATGALAILVGGIYLVVRRLIPWQIPLGVLLGAAVMSLVAAYTDPNLLELGYGSFALKWGIATFHLASGGLMLSAFFLAPEPVSSPVTPWGTLLFGLGVGLMAVIVRTWGSPVDGVFYGVLVMNAATPLFDRIRPRVLGKVTVNV